LKGTLSYLAAAPAQEAARHVERLGADGDAGAAEARTRIEALERDCTLLNAALADHCLAVRTAP